MPNFFAFLAKHPPAELHSRTLQNTQTTHHSTTFTMQAIAASNVVVARQFTGAKKSFAVKKVRALRGKCWMEKINPATFACTWLTALLHFF